MAGKHESAEAGDGAESGASGYREDVWVAPRASEFLTDEERLFEVFHENSKLNLATETATGQMFAKIFQDANLERTLSNAYRRNPGLDFIALPPPRPIEKAYSSVVESRRSGRQLSGRPISIEHVSTLLHSAYGITGTLELVGGIQQKVRAVPSGGALYPLEIYLVASAVDGLVEGGVYHYAVAEHGLEELPNRVSVEDLAVTLMGGRPEGILRSAATFIISALFVRMTFKYGDRGYRYALMECGAVCAQIDFAACALGLGSGQVGGFYDQILERYMGADGVNESVLNTVVVGSRPH